MEAVKNFLFSDAFLHNIFVILSMRLVILLVVLKVINILVGFFTKKFTAKIDNVEQKKQIYTISVTCKSIIDIVVVALFIMEALPKLGIDIRPILTAAGVLGVAIGFGSKRLVEDILSGMLLIMEGQIRVGDIIEIGDKFGIVEKLNLKMIMLRDWDGRIHYIRPGMVDIVTNYTREYAFSIIKVSVAYKENIDKVIKTVVELGNTELKNGKLGKYVLSDVEAWGLDNFGDSAIDIKFRVKTETMHQWSVTREFNRLIKNKFDEVGIEIPFPQCTVHIENN